MEMPAPSYDAYNDSALSPRLVAVDSSTLGDLLDATKNGVKNGKRHNGGIGETGILQSMVVFY